MAGKPKNGVRAQLSQKEEQFCWHYIMDGMEPVDAIAQSGFSCSSRRNQYNEARRVLSRDIVKKRINELIEQRDREFLLDKKFVVDNLKRIAIEQKGKPGELRAIELLGKSIGAFDDKKVQDIGAGHAQLADEAWEKRAKEIVEKNPKEAKFLGLLKKDEDLKKVG